MANKPDTKAVQGEVAVASAPAVAAPGSTDKKVLVRFKKNTQVSECGGVFAAGSTARVKKHIAEALVAEGWAVKVGI